MKTVLLKMMLNMKKKILSTTGITSELVSVCLFNQVKYTLIKEFY
jgi:hypothetical protein